VLHEHSSTSERRVQPARSREPALGRLRLAAEILRTDGAWALVWRALAVLGARRLSVNSLDPTSWDGASTVAGLTLRSLAESDLPAYRELRREADEFEAERRLRTGAQCVGAWRHERLVAVRWLASGRIEIPYLGLSVQLNEGVAYAYDAFTAPDERRRGIANLVAAQLFDLACANGTPSVIHAVLPENHEGRALARGHTRSLGMLGSLKLGRWRVAVLHLPPGHLGSPLALSA